jgi:cell division protein FtsW
VAQASRALQVPQASLAPAEAGGVDLWLLIPTLALVSLGVAMVYSASIPVAASQGGSVLSYLLREVAFVGVGVLGMMGAMRIGLERLAKSAWALLLLTVALLAGLFFVPGRNGAHSWYSLGPLSFQPSEMAKLVLVIVTARYFAHFPRGLSARAEAYPPFLVMFVVVGLIAIEPDAGTAAVTFGAMLVYFHVAGARMRHLLAAGALAAIPAGVLLWHHPYQVRRIVDFGLQVLGKGRDLELFGGYQKARSLIALGSGGLTGSGYCGSVEKYFYLPAATTDSILAVVGEELGMIATWGVLALFGLLVWRGMQVARRAPDRFSGLVAAGVTAVIAVQALLNIAVVTGSIPATGVTLPFVSYGGSSLLFSMIGMGLLLNISRQCREPESVGKAP